jgi:hydrogenase-4 component F
MSLASTLVFAFALVVSVPVLTTGVPLVDGTGLWYVDALSALLVLLIGAIQWTASFASGTYIGQEAREGTVTLPLVRRYYALAALFVFSMLTAVVADNLGVLWIALEATTLATTFLVAFYVRPSSLEAAWKYLVLCSTGIALGLVSVLVVYTAATSAGAASGFDALRISTLLQTLSALSPAMMKVAFAFALVGYGTKIGLAPMHTWLPDAHSSAPAPISALLSGVLLNAAFLALMRYKMLTDGALGDSAFTNGLLLGIGVLTVVVAAFFIIAQTDYKRLLAYSSIEHMGFVVFSVGLGAAGTVAAIIEIVGHAFVKSMLFFGAGNILLRFHSTKFAKVAGVYRVLPITGGLFLIGTLFLLAAPPSPLFMSEYLAIAAGIGTHPYAVAAVLLALAIALAGFIRLVVPMLFAESAPEALEREVVSGERLTGASTAMVLHLIILVALFVACITGLAFPVLARIANILT